MRKPLLQIPSTLGNARKNSARNNEENFTGESHHPEKSCAPRTRERGRKMKLHREREPYRNGLDIVDAFEWDVLCVEDFIQRIEHIHAGSAKPNSTLQTVANWGKTRDFVRLAFDVVGHVFGITRYAQTRLSSHVKAEVVAAFVRLRAEAELERNIDVRSN